MNDDRYTYIQEWPRSREMFHMKTGYDYYLADPSDVSAQSKI